MELYIKIKIAIDSYINMSQYLNKLILISVKYISIFKVNVQSS